MYYNYLEEHIQLCMHASCLYYLKFNVQFWDEE